MNTEKLEQANRLAEEIHDRKEQQSKFAELWDRQKNAEKMHGSLLISDGGVRRELCIPSSILEMVVDFVQQQNDKLIADKTAQFEAM